MTLLRVLVLGILSITTNTFIASEFKCPTPSQFQNVACENSLTVRTLTELISYKSNLGIVNGKARNLIIDFDINTNDLVLATPCKITIAEKRSENLSGDLCLHGDLGVELLGYNNLSAMDVRLESKQAVKTNEYSNLNILDLEMISLGDNSLSKVSIGQGSKIDASNLVLESFDTASIASYVDIKASLGVNLSSTGAGNASIAEDTNISAKTFDQSTKLLASLAQDDSISAEVVTISGSSCSVFSGTTINANEKLGTCFLYSYPNKLFTASANNGFKPLTIYFDASKISSSKFIWSFGDGVAQTTSSSKTSHTYDQAGTFSATLKYLSDGQYKNAGSIQIYVKDSSPRPPVAPIACTPNNMLVNCNALGSYDPQGQPLIYSFTYSDGFFEENNTGLSSHAFSAPGLYQVSVSVSNLFGLSAIASTQVQAMLPPNVLPKVMLNCSSSKPFYIECDSIGSTDSDGQIVSFQYSFDDGSVVTKSDTSKIAHTFSTGGNHQVQLVAIDNDGGVSSLSKTFSVLNNSNPIADFSCTSDKPYQISCLSNSSDPDAPNDFITEYSWIVNNQTITSSQGSSLDFNFFAGGDFPVTLIVKDSLGGSASVTKTIAVKPNFAPVASFTCSNTSVRSVHCASTSTDSDGSIASSSWVLDDGSNFSGTSFDYTFADDNSHSVTLIVADDLGTSASVSQIVTPIKNQAPTGDILASTLSGSAPLSVNFTAQNALDSDGSIASIAWSFSDGATATGQSVTHIFNSIGSFTATMTITDNLGARVTKSVNISALEPLKEAPLALFKLYQIGTLAELHSYVSKTQFEIKKAYYTIDGGQVVNLTEYYPDTIKVVDMLTYGKHKVDLTVEDVRGQVKTYSLSYTQIHNLASLAAYNDFSVSQSAVRTVFVDLSKIYNFDLDQTIKNYRVEYGDGTYEDTTNLFTSHIYASAGTYQVKVTATTSALYSVSNTVSKTVTVTNSDVAISNPIAGFTYRIYDFAQNVSFYNDRSVTPNGSIISYAWDFGDGSTGTGQKVAHFYTPGSYLVTLTVTDTAGLRSSETQHITISNPGVDLEASVDCNIAYPYVEYIQTCKVVTLDRLGQLSRIRITWGDGGVSNLALNSTQGVNKPTHTYVNPSNYPVMVTAFTTRGETKNVATNLNLGHYSSNLLPIASLSCSSDLLNMTCSAQGSRDPQNQELTYIIDWGDGQRDVSPSTSLQHSYQIKGTYDVTLSVLNTTELVSSVVKTYTVIDHNIYPTINCTTNNLLVSCNAIGTYDLSGSALTYSFDFGDNYVETNAIGVTTHGYTQPGLFTVTLKVTNTKGENAIVTTQVMPVLPPNQLPVAKFNCNSPSPFVVYCSDAGSSDADGSIISRKLTFDDNSEEYLSVTTSTRHQFATSGAHSVTLTVIDNDGGVGTLTQSIDVKSNTNPIASFTCSTPGPQRLSCYSTSRDPDSGDMIGTLDWEYGDGGSTSGVATAFDHTYSTSGSFNVSLTVHDQYGGSNTLTQSFATLENQAPLASVNCFITTGSTYQCDGSASDSDGTIASQTFTVDGVSLGSGSSIQYEFTNGGDHEVVYTATDDLGKSTSVSKTIKIDKPIADMVCSIVENLKVQCKPNLSMNMSNIVFIKYVYDGFYEDDGNVSEFTFSHFGDHKVEILVLSNDKTFATQTININIPKIHLPPKADFKYVVIDSLNTSFNGLNSLFQERDVSKYEWSFGDGSTQESTDGMVSHNYTSTGYYYVVLTVTDSLGEKNSLSKKIYIYNPEVPDPGEAGDSTIEGVDSDNDGVRDDIQRWISFEAKDNYRLKTALKKLASIYQSNNLHYMDISLSKSLLLQKTKIEFCIKGLLNDDLNFNHIRSFIQYLNYDTEERASLRFKIMKNLSGNDNLAFPTNQHDQLLYCGEQGI